MKFSVPDLEVDSEDPFGERDLLERGEFADRLTNLVTSIDDRLVLSLTAPWGEGKTTFVRMWQAKLRQTGIGSLYFDAYARDFAAEPFVSIVSAICDSLENEFDSEELRPLVPKLRERAAKAGAHLLAWGVKLGVKIATLNALTWIIREWRSERQDSVRIGLEGVVGGSQG